MPTGRSLRRTTSSWQRPGWPIAPPPSRQDRRCPRSMGELRVGCGYDLHAFAPDRGLVLAGVVIEHARGLAGHSDADVLTHALIDALLGAAGLGDMGDWFPSSDQELKGVESLTLLDRVLDRLMQDGWRIVNVDTTVVAQEPRLGGHRPHMKRQLAARLGIA